MADPVADAVEAERLYGLKFVDVSSLKDMDAVVLAVAHDEFKSLSMKTLDSMFGSGAKVLLDLKGLLNRKKYETAGYSYWRL